MAKNKALGSFTTLLDDWKTSFNSRMTKSCIQKEVPIGNNLPSAGRPAEGWKHSSVISVRE
jgi:hypothetical protein